jgi:hypothetical protein
LKESDADRAARLENNQKLEQLLKESEESEERARTNLEALKKNKIVRLLLRLGLLSARETGEQER